MKFSIGHKLIEDEPGGFLSIVRDYRDAIEEVYFAWPGEPSGRSPVDAGAESRAMEELAAIKRLGVKLNLLLNASCYGDRAMSCGLERRVIRLVGDGRDRLGLDAVTTMSPLVARTVRRHFPDLDVRASVNLRLGTVKAMQYAAPFFTSYCIQREFNRDPGRLEELQAWAQANGKRLHVLANSACLNFCSFQTFHDNAVAHEAALGRRRNVESLTTLCREYYAAPEHRVSFLQGSWIRPEDISKHSHHFHGGYKLATRMHDRPRLVIDAYARGRHVGNLLDLMEPGFGPVFNPTILDNRRFPEGWFEATTRCGKQCNACDYCARTWDAVAFELD